MKNHLKNQTSPYLLQHADNPVHWYPWCEEAFSKAKMEDKPVFLSIGYSTCHWCHVMAHESFEDEQIAAILNQHFISIKVDKEERPDIDSIYMSVCQAFTGSGGWPTTIFMTPEQKPFFAGTYFPKASQPGMIGFEDLLKILSEKWVRERSDLMTSADKIVSYLNQPQALPHSHPLYRALLDNARMELEHSFDSVYGGFSSAPKFPMPQNLLYLMALNLCEKNTSALYMV